MNDKRWAAKHLTMLGVFHIVYHAFAFFIGIGIIVLLSYLGDLTADPQGHAVLTMLGSVLGSILIVVAVSGVVAGIGLLKRQSWARMLTLMVGAVDLLDVPLGTALGIYTFWVLMRDEVVGYFAEL